MTYLRQLLCHYYCGQSIMTYGIKSYSVISHLMVDWTSPLPKQFLLVFVFFIYLDDTLLLCPLKLHLGAYFKENTFMDVLLFCWWGITQLSRELLGQSAHTKTIENLFSLELLHKKISPEFQANKAPSTWSINCCQKPLSSFLST